jgi:haloacetate dehalogenase
LWGAEGFVGRSYEVLEVWQDYADDLRGHAVGGGHFVAEERPAETIAALRDFLG